MLTHASQGNREWFVALENVFHEEIASFKPKEFKVKGKAAGKLLTAGQGAGNYTFLEVYEAGQ